MLTAVVGTGAVGGRIARRLAEEPSVSQVLVCGRRPLSPGGLAGGFERVRECRLADVLQADLAVIATPPGTHLSLASRLIREHTAVVSVSDHPEEVRGLLAMDSQAASKGVSLLVGAAFSPGLTCVLATHAAAGLEEVSAIHVSRHGSAGPACARRYHAALKRSGWLRSAGVWQRRRGGSGREISWFPDPIGPVDCYFGELAEPHLLATVFPEVPFITARRAAARQDRLTSRLPMLAPPVFDGSLGAVRVVLRGVAEGQSVVRVLGTAHGPAAAAASVASAAVCALAAGEIQRAGAFSLGTALPPLKFLRRLIAEGISPVTFSGAVL